jgi:Domain of unknown function (DUF4398)
MKHVFNGKTYQTLCGIGIVAVAIVSCTSIPPPTEQLAVSKMAVSNATIVGANEYASEDMRAAQDKLDRAVKAMNAEDYKNALTLAEQAQVDAQLATAKTRAAKAEKAANIVVEDSRVLQKELERKQQ